MGYANWQKGLGEMSLSAASSRAYQVQRVLAPTNNDEDQEQRYLAPIQKQQQCLAPTESSFSIVWVLSLSLGYSPFAHIQESSNIAAYFEVHVAVHQLFARVLSSKAWVLWR